MMWEEECRLNDGPWVARFNQTQPGREWVWTAWKAVLDH